MKGLSFTAIDFETANGSRLSACAVGLCMVEEGEIVKKAAFLIKPPESVRHFDYFQTSVHGITEKDVRNSGEFCDIWDEIEPMLKNRVIAAHNLPFDLSVLKKLTGYYSLPEVPSGYLCTLKLSRKAFPMLASHRLDSVCSFLGFPMNGTHHMAGADAEAAARILIHFAKSRSRNNISEISEYVDTTDPVLSGTIFTNVDAEIYREESEYSEILERIRSETREVSGFFIQKLIEKKKEDGEETGKPTVRQLEFMVKLRSETGVPLFRDDIATRNTASDWISKALEEKNKKTVLYTAHSYER